MSPGTDRHPSWGRRGEARLAGSGQAQRKAGRMAAGQLGRVEPREMSPCWRLIFPDVEHAAASSYLHEHAASDCSPATIRRYAYALLGRRVLKLSLLMAFRMVGKWGLIARY